MGLVYLIHFDKRLKHAGHYIGYVKDEEGGLDERLKKHRNGSGSKLLKAVVNSGISFEVARTWLNSSQSYERRIKRAGGASRYCPICRKLKKEIK